MSKRTFIYLHSTELSQASWVHCNNNIIEHSVLRGHLADFPDDYKQDEIMVFVPATDILLTQVALPKLSQSRLLQALPYALEEQLIDDVNELHFAISADQANDLTFAAVVAKKKITEWLTLFKQYNITPNQLYSNIFLLPFIENNWSIGLLQENAIVRQQRLQGFSCELINLPLLLDLALKAADNKPECLHVYNTTNTAFDFTTTPVNPIRLSEQEWLEKIPTTFSTAHAIDLLQGQYRAKRKTSETKKIWLLAGYAAIACIALAFFSQLVSFVILHHQAAKIETAIDTIYQKNFPQANAITAPRERMETRLATLEEQANKNYFLVLLAQISHQLSQDTAIQLKTLDFRDNQLTLDVLADKFDTLDAFTQTISQQHLQVKQQNAAVAGDKVKATLLIQRGNA